MKPGKGGQLARSAGTYVQLVGRDQGYALCACFGRSAHGARRMPGDDRRRVEPRPSEHRDRQSRSQPLAWRRPSVRGVAMNPIDHPHGGGEGKILGRAASGDPVGQADQG